MFHSRQRGTGWCYDPEMVFSGQKGAGNNWAYGYSHYGNEVCELILNKIRKLAERLDRRNVEMIRFIETRFQSDEDHSPYAESEFFQLVSISCGSE